MAGDCHGPIFGGGWWVERSAGPAAVLVRHSVTWHEDVETR